MTIEQLDRLEFAANKVVENDKKATGEMRRGGARCCLAVMCDAAKDFEVIIEDNEAVPDKDQFKSFFGFDMNRYFTIDNERDILANHNDGIRGFDCDEGEKPIRPKTHEEIGEVLLEFVKQQRKFFK